MGELIGEARPLWVGSAVGLTRAFRSGTKAAWLPGANATARGTGCVEFYAHNRQPTTATHHSGRPVPSPCNGKGGLPYAHPNTQLS